MDLNALIEELQKIRNKHGNMPVGVPDFANSNITKNPGEEFATRNLLIFPIEKVFHGTSGLIIIPHKIEDYDKGLGEFLGNPK